jgi:hypothetical protein
MRAIARILPLHFTLSSSISPCTTSISKFQISIIHRSITPLKSARGLSTALRRNVVADSTWSREGILQGLKLAHEGPMGKLLPPLTQVHAKLALYFASQALNYCA